METPPKLESMPILCRSVTLPAKTTISKWRVTATIRQLLQLPTGGASAYKQMCTHLPWFLYTVHNISTGMYKAITKHEIFMHNENIARKCNDLKLTRCIKERQIEDLEKVQKMSNPNAKGKRPTKWKHFQLDD